jgi:malonyl-CoA/methylmalonyl-CoA synthetase
MARQIPPPTGRDPRPSNATEPKPVLHLDLLDHLDRHADRPDAVFLTTPDGRTLTYAGLRDEARRLAAGLARLGAVPGDRIAVQVEKSPEAIVLFYAALSGGFVYLPLNTSYTLAELEYFIGDAEPAIIVVGPAAREGVAAIVHGQGRDAAILTLDAAGKGSLADLIKTEAESGAPAPREPDDLAAILYTSGTTGRSKGAMLTRRNLASNAEALAEAWRFTAEDRLLHALPIFHVHGLFVATNTILVAGGSLLFLAKFDADEIVRLLPTVTTFMGVPTFYTRLLQHPGLTPESVKSIRLFVSGSAPLLAETHRAFRAKTGHVILERYGMTETSMNTSNPYDGERVPGSVGPALPGVEVRVADPETGEVLGVGEVGVIEVRGPNVFKGYWRMPEKTLSEFRPDGFFITGDVGTIDERGYVTIVGRAKDLIISGGYNVYPKEVEMEIDALPGVVESAVFGVPHPDFGEGVTAAVVVTKGAKIDEATVQAALADRLARFKQPKRVFVVPDLPRNTMGKVQKNVLRETYAKTFQG